MSERKERHACLHGYSSCEFCPSCRTELEECPICRLLVDVTTLEPSVGYLAGELDVAHSQSAALRHDIERSIARETEHVNRIEALEKALEPFAKMSCPSEAACPDDEKWGWGLMIGDIRFARAVLSQGDRTASVSDQRELETKMSYCRINDESDVYAWRGPGNDYFVSVNQADPSDVAFTAHGLVHLQWLLAAMQMGGYQVPEAAFERIEREIAQGAATAPEPSEA